MAAPQATRALRAGRNNPTRGRLILITTDLALPAIDAIRLYDLRFKIELSFKQALRVLGVYAYHFWMRAMPESSAAQALSIYTTRTLHTAMRCAANSALSAVTSRSASSPRASCNIWR